jgi:hypothetical protein
VHLVDGSKVLQRKVLHNYGEPGWLTCASASWTAGNPWFASSTPATSSWLVLCWECVPSRVFWSLDKTVLKSEAEGIVGRLGATPTSKCSGIRCQLLRNRNNIKEHRKVKVMTPIPVWSASHARRVTDNGRLQKAGVSQQKPNVSQNLTSAFLRQKKTEMTLFLSSLFPFSFKSPGKGPAIENNHSVSSS